MKKNIHIWGLTALLATATTVPAVATGPDAGTHGQPATLASSPYKGKIRKVYKAIQDGDILKAKEAMQSIDGDDIWNLYPVYELADCYLRTQTATGEYSPVAAYRNLLKITSRGERITEADAFLFDYGLSVAKIRAEIEQSMYNDAAKANTLEALDAFLRDIQNDGLREKAEKLRMEAAYTALQQSLDAYNCDRFLQRYPTGKYSDEVRRTRNRLVYESIGDNITQLQDYIRKYPDSEYIPDARARIEQFNLPVFTASQARQVAEAQLAGKKVLGAYPYSNTKFGNDQIIVVAENTAKAGDGQQGIFLVEVPYKGIYAITYLPRPSDANPVLDPHTVDVVDKQRIADNTYIIICYRNFSYGTECRDCVERVYAVYNPDNMAFHKVVFSGKDYFAPDGTLDRIDGDWLPADDNSYTQWLKDYAGKRLKQYIK